MNRKLNSNKTRKQSGAALVTALVLLTIMTMLAMTSMSTNTLEEKMAANVQEMNRAFQIAESGLKLAMGDADAFDPINSVNDNGTPFDESDDIYDYQVTNTTLSTAYTTEIVYRAWFREEKGAGGSRGGGYDVDKSLFFFDLESTGSTQTAISTSVHSGAYQVGPGSNISSQAPAAAGGP